jgi:hypothetical protein
MTIHGYYESDGKIVGPLTPAELREHCAAGLIVADTPISKGENGSWTPAGQIQGLADLLSRQPRGKHGGRKEGTGKLPVADEDFFKIGQSPRWHLWSGRGWLVSLAVHALLLAIMALWMIAPEPEGLAPIVAVFDDSVESALEEPEEIEVEVVEPLEEPVEVAEPETEEPREPDVLSCTLDLSLQRLADQQEKDADIISKVMLYEITCPRV